MMSETIADLLTAALARREAERLRERREAGRPRTRKKNRPRCGAKTRAGPPCQAPAVWDNIAKKPRNGRCRMHGGLSTGPKVRSERFAMAPHAEWEE